MIAIPQPLLTKGIILKSLEVYKVIMPIIIKNFDWSETESTVTIKVPMRIISKKADIFMSTRYLKISYEQYFFDVILLRETDIAQNRCTITDEQVILELFKLEKLLWGNLEPDISKCERQQLKQQLIEEEHKRLQDECAEKQTKKYELSRVAVREQMCLDTKQRNQIDENRNREKNEAMGNIGDWVDQRNIKPSLVKKKLKCRKATERDYELEKNIDDIEEKQEKEEPLPLPRQSCTLQIDFTPREFPTPSRESRLEEENEWLKKQAEARRSVGFISEDIRPEERNPQFLKAKGDEFMKNQNYLGAISAYSFGINLTDKYVDLYIGRSEAHLAQGNYHKTAQDCSSALDLLKPEVPANLKERAVCIGRRGIALCKLGLLQQGISELQASLRLIPDDHFKQELEYFEKVLEDKEDESD